MVPAIEPTSVNIARPGPAAPQDVAAIATLLSNAERPVIFAGGGFKWGNGREALTALAEKLEIPVVASTGHADVMRHGHAWFAGQAGPRGNRVASRLTKEADVMLVLGARLGFNSTFHSYDYVGQRPASPISTSTGPPLAAISRPKLPCRPTRD